MTTKPKARKFRIRRPGTGAPDPLRNNAEGASEKQGSDGPVATGAAKSAPASASGEAPSHTVGASEDLAGTEALTGRQLRMARRVASRHGIEARSDVDAVHQLKARGIDPFQRSNMLELVVRDPKDSAPEEDSAPAVRLPQTRPPDSVPSTRTPSPSERRAAEIVQIQNDLARRRRRRLGLLLARLSFLVLLPTLIAGIYFYAVATPMYSTKSEFLILKAETAGGGGMGSLLSGTQFATNQDAIAVQSYLMSKDAMLRLDRDVGFKSHFTQDWIDPIQRLQDAPSNEEAYALYKRNIEIGFDPTEGVIRMEIVAADPAVAAEFSNALLSYAEERVDNLSLRKRSNAVRDAEDGLVEAQDARREAQERLVRMQQDGAVIDPEGRIAALRSQINNIEIQLQEKQLQLQALLDNRRPNESRVQGAEGDIRRLETLLAELNAEMTTATTGGDSLAEKAVQIKLAEADLATRDLMLQTALERLEQARRDADSQARYLTTSVEPVPSEDPSYPRKFENTVLAFLIFGGIYLMISLTASILREQVTS
ncbi:capsule biosynthesis protein [Citreimonas salinaria]|uniref:Capsular polysaccharide transport system permease protein n=1 Tax=Citreimonas salinaria TaxID=321339 RepID=A0A1H3NPZ8_9RHOB|nr:capsule biosynthesis protein [Citreimonas salinaria]SDY90996.1 capsular polysaccharide transport system permease protein [Citreimonas salinaria]